MIDDCNQCVLSESFNSSKDCLGNCGGFANYDQNGICCNESSWDCSGECFGFNVEDCAGICGGDAVVDECGECGGSGIGDGACDCNGNVEDCMGVCDGDTLIKECGICTNEDTCDCPSTENCPEGFIENPHYTGGEYEEECYPCGFLFYSSIMQGFYFFHEDFKYFGLFQTTSKYIVSCLSICASFHR